MDGVAPGNAWRLRRMSIQDDIDELKTLQESFRNIHGRYFEIDNEKPFEIPTQGDVLNTTELTRFKKGFCDLPAAPDKISFTPTAKDYHFIIGNGTRRSEGKMYYCYMITAIRKNSLTSKIEKVTYTGGNKEAFEE